MAVRLNDRGVQSADHETWLWELVEVAWAPLGAEVNMARRVLAARRPGEALEQLPVLKGAREAFAASLASQCRGLTAMELTALDRVVERKL